MELLSARRGCPHSEPQSARKNARFAHLAQLALVEFFNLKLTNVLFIAAGLCALCHTGASVVYCGGAVCSAGLH